MRLQTFATLFALMQPSLYSASAFDQLVLSQQRDDSPFVTSGPTLADLLTIEPSASIFFSYAREVEIGKLLDDRDAMITLLVPTNKAVMASARKPNEDPLPIDERVITEEEFDARSKRNVQRWVSAHTIPKSPIEFDSKTYDTLLDGRSVKFELVEGDTAPEWTRVQINGDRHIVGSKQALNGVYYLIDGTVDVD